VIRKNTLQKKGIPTGGGGLHSPGAGKGVRDISGKSTGDVERKVPFPGGFPLLPLPWTRADRDRLGQRPRFNQGTEGGIEGGRKDQYSIGTPTTTEGRRGGEEKG